LPNTTKTGKRRGFTLGEVLVTIALISVLAAVVIPVVTGQMAKGDIGRISSDLLAIRGGMEQFISDVRRYPNSVSQLTNKPGTTTAFGPLPAAGNTTCPNPQTFAVTYNAQEVARWRGPYISKDSTAALQTGYSQSIRPCFHSVLLAGTNYETVLVPGIDNATALAIDIAMDDGVVTTGALQWAARGVSTMDTLKFFALPIQP
jgi:prepilin-type N-terminal cleavage/methylation domain-containing protein